MSREEILIEIRQILHNFYVIIDNYLNGGYHLRNNYLEHKVRWLKKVYENENTSEVAALEAHLRAITTWIALNLEELYKEYYDNKLLRNDIENLQQKILESERYTIISLNKKIIETLHKVIYHDLLKFYDI